MLPTTVAWEGYLWSSTLQALHADNWRHAKLSVMDAPLLFADTYEDRLSYLRARILLIAIVNKYPIPTVTYISSDNPVMVLENRVRITSTECLQAYFVSVSSKGNSELLCRKPGSLYMEHATAFKVSVRIVIVVKRVANSRN